MKAGRLRGIDRKSTRLNSSHSSISYAVFCLKKYETSQRDEYFRDDDLRQGVATQEARARVIDVFFLLNSVRCLHRRSVRFAKLFFFKNWAPPQIFSFSLHAPLSG